MEQITEDSLDKVVADSRVKVGNQVNRGCSWDRSADSSDRVTKGKALGRTRSHRRRRRRRRNVKKGKDASDDMSGMSANSQKKVVNAEKGKN